MARSLKSFIFAIATIVAGGVAAQEQVPAARTIYERGVDLVGTDLAQIFDTTAAACEAACLNNSACTAFTFNQRSNACFPKTNVTDFVPFEGALSARVYATDPAVLAGAAARMAELNFLRGGDFETAANLARLSNQPIRNASQSQRAAWDRALATDLAIDWIAFGRNAGVSNSRVTNMALPAYVKAYLRSLDLQTRRAAAMSLAYALEDAGRGRRMIDALRLAQALRFDRETEAQLDEAIGKYGFRVVDTKVESDSATPRICAIFNEDLINAGTDYTPFVQLPQTQLVVTVSDAQLCVDGVEHGERYRIILRNGLPAASGETLTYPVEITLYVRDRAPSLRFASSAYVLPRTGDIAIPLETVNMSQVDLSLSRIDDRNLMRTIQSGLMDRSVSRYGGDLSTEIGTSIWSGTADVAQELNRDMLTRLPLGDVLIDEPAGLYALTARSTNDSDEIGTTTQWFVLSDIGVATYLGNDGLTVAARGLGDALAIADAQVTLVSRSNAVLAEAQTDADGVAQFAAGLTRGTGGNAPALVTVALGDDMTFLSLTDAAFDLSDRGVEGREPSQPIDVFMATDRGAYRAGDTIHLTALTRDQTALGLDGIPLTAVLIRPDGVEYSRQISTDDRAGGHVFALPVASTAPRGTWRISVQADADSGPLAQTTVLVEDFLPERIDFDLALPDAIRLGDTPNLRVDARYLFGAIGSDLDVEGEALLYAANSLDGFPGYRFGQYDARFDGQLNYLDGGVTNGEGIANLPVALPDVDATQPLELRVTARVKEGSGRPVERQITVPVLPDLPMIGIKPLFDGVISEDSTAPFELIALNPDMTGADMRVQWTVNKVRTRYQWYRLHDRWHWEPTTTRTRIATGEAALGTLPTRVEANVEWGQHEIVVEAIGGSYVAASDEFYAGWYAPASADDTPDLLEASLDAPAYAVGDTATFRVVPRYAGQAVITVMSDRLISMKTVPVTEGENLITLPVTEEWGAGAYVSASVIRPMSVAENRNPSRALGLGYAQVDPGDKALQVSLQAPATMQPRGPMDIAVQVDGVRAGETAYVTLAAVDLGILNLTGFESPDPQGYYFGQRKLGVEIRDVYGRLIDGLNGAMGNVRSGGDAVSAAGMQSPPPTEELVTYFTGPVSVDANGQAQVRFDLPAFNGTIRLMAIAWSDTGVGQAEQDVIVRDPVVLTASVPRFLAPGDQSRVLLEIVHADGPAGEMGLQIAANGLGLVSQIPPSFTLAEGGKQVFEIPFAAFDVGNHSIDITLTTPDGRALVKSLNVPVVVNDPEVSRISRFNLGAGRSFIFDDDVFAGLVNGTGKATLSAGPLARFDAPGLLNTLDRYPYGCTEQITSRALPLLYLDGVAAAMGLATRDTIQERVTQAIAEVTSNQSANGAFGLWRPSSGDLWLDAYVTDFLTRARLAGYAVPDVAYGNAVANLRNAVNYYPDFDEGGTDLAYALFVLAREGEAAVGDLRYYADQKADAFTSPLAIAQVGAALAQYGDQPRADAMFARAGRMLFARIAAEERRLWRSDYGTYRRDTAAVLALAVEAGSNAIDRDQLVQRIATDASHVSTQEAAWTLLAANALVDDLRTTGLTIDGLLPDGPVVQLRDAQTGAAPVTVTNTGVLPTEITVTTFGVPSEPEPAGGNGYAIERTYFTTEGREVNLGNVAVGTRLVTVLTVRPFGRQEARLMVNDPLPAGFEIDNPNLLSGGDIRALDWIESTYAENAEFRTDRFLAAVDRRSDEPFRLAYIVRAVSPGDFYHPAASVEDMYRPQMRARTDAGNVTITP
ncbi:alpha-2-macroglobulin family protein [Loktanella sp. D2R18]|uniref:alpha-2-macroglobulin family protein n=1 Tax=Rhodobacterales TaxID=204455 RepID=UPI000DE8E17F|nr:MULTISPECIES: MG2 domain-containing protein [Rhodobacterales]MDO6591814.1 MG2 domain-containing protein [Yoonia sp. 1_MG-2023]RBW44885.1 alpha-2-macroglobulin family protein [Loktanella sp. D2R18]